MPALHGPRSSDSIGLICILKIYIDKCSVNGVPWHLKVWRTAAPSDVDGGVTGDEDETCKILAQSSNVLIWHELL